MPDKTRVSAVFRIKRDEEEQVLAAEGWLHRTVTAWVLTCQMPADSGEADQPAAPSTLTLVMRENEIRLNRGGAVMQDQVFRIGEWKRGTIGTSYGKMNAEAHARCIEVRLQPSGGTAVWEYDWRVADSDLGRYSIKLEVREEVAQ